MITERIDAVTNIPENRKGTIVSSPISVKIELSSYCDLKCYFCSHSKEQFGGFMDFDFYKKILDDLKSIGVKEIGVFFLGESLLYPKLAEAIRYAKKDCKFEYVFLTTNGRLLTKNKSFEIMDAGLDSLKFSTNFSRYQYYKMTGLDGYDLLLDNIRAANEVRKDNGFKCGIYASSIKIDEAQISLMQETIAEIKPSIDKHYWLPLYGDGGTQGNCGRLAALRQPLPCWQLFTEGHISQNGHVCGCCFSHAEAFDFGNLHNMSFMKAWNCKKAQELREASLKLNVTGTACEECIKREAVNNNTGS